MTITEFLLARIAEDEEVARAAQGEAIFQHQTGRWSFETIHDEYGPIPIVFAVADGGGKTQVANLESAWEREQRGAHIARHDPSRVLAECETKRRIVEFHKSWPVLVQQQPTFEDVDGDLSTVTYRMSQRMAWFTDQQYRDTFGDEPPTAPMLAAMATVYADHPDYREEWRTA